MCGELRDEQAQAWTQPWRSSLVGIESRLLGAPDPSEEEKSYARGVPEAKDTGIPTQNPMWEKGPGGGSSSHPPQASTPTGGGRGHGIGGGVG